MDFLKSIAGKLITGAVALAVIASGISWWRMEPSAREAVLAGSGKILGWLGVVLFLPWVTFFVIAKVGRMQSNLAGAVLVATYTIAEAVLLAWLFGWSISGATAWTMFAVGVLFAAAYNLFTCDWIAEATE